MYWVTIIYPEWENGKKTGKIVAEVVTRYFTDLDKEPDLKAWKMEGEPENGLAWTEETGSVHSEKVYAWMPMEDIQIAKLPKGVVSIESTANLNLNTESQNVRSENCIISQLMDYLMLHTYSCPLRDDANIDFEKECVGFKEVQCRECIIKHIDELRY